MELVLLPQAQADRDYWKKTGNTAIMKRISALLADILEHREMSLREIFLRRVVTHAPQFFFIIFRHFLHKK